MSVKVILPPKYIKHANPATKRPQQPAPVK